MTTAFTHENVIKLAGILGTAPELRLTANGNAEAQGRNIPRRKACPKPQSRHNDPSRPDAHSRNTCAARFTVLGPSASGPDGLLLRGWGFGPA